MTKSIKISVMDGANPSNSDLVTQFHETKRLFPNSGLRHIKKQIRHHNQDIQLKLWDVPLVRNFRSNADNGIGEAMVMVYDVNDKESFDKIKSYLTDVNKESNCYMVKFVVGLYHTMENRVVSYQEGEKLAANYGLKFAEVSAQDKSQVEDFFSEVTTQVVHKINEREDHHSIFRGNKVSPMKENKRPASVLEGKGRALEFENAKQDSCGCVVM